MAHASSSGNARSICARWQAVAGSERSFTPKQEQCIHAATPAVRPTIITSEISSTAFSGSCKMLSGQLPVRSCPVLVHVVASALAARVPATSRLCGCVEAAPKQLPLSTTRLNIPSDWTSSAIIVPSIGVSPWVLVPSTARATLGDHHWLVQRPLERLFAVRACRSSACSLPLPHFLGFYANVVDLLLGSRSTVWTTSTSQAWRRSHLTGRVLAFG